MMRNIRIYCYTTFISPITESDIDGTLLQVMAPFGYGAIVTTSTHDRMLLNKYVGESEATLPIYI